MCFSVHHASSALRSTSRSSGEYDEFTNKDIICAPRYVTGTLGLSIGRALNPFADLANIRLLDMAAINIFVT
jgi:hypothetical protein